MADCCQELKAELSVLKAEIAKLKPVDEESIIRRAVNRSENKIIPQIPDIAYAAVIPAVGFIVSQKIAPVASTANQALNTGNTALSKANSALGKIAGIAATLASLAASVATLLVLGSRIDALEAFIDSLAAQLSKAFSLIGANKSAIARVENKADSAKNQADKALVEAQSASRAASRAGEKADQAIATANRADGKADQAIAIANRADGKADQAIAIANRAEGRADQAIAIASQASTKAQQALGLIPVTDKVASEALGKAIQALQRVLLPGPQGKPGRDGKQGIQGIPGIPGRAGRDGKDGKQGIPGIPGRPGRDGKQGTQGIPGIAGRPGRDGKDGKNGKDGEDAKLDAAAKALLKTIEQKVDRNNGKLDLIPPLVAPIATLGTKINRLPGTSGFQQAVRTATCSTMQNAGCRSGIRNDMRQELGRNNGNLASQIGAGTGAANLALNQQQLGLLNTINTKIGPQVPGGLSTFLTNFGKWMHLDRVMNTFTFLGTIHNAYMLSGNLSQTFFSTLDNLGGIFFKDKDGQNIDSQALIGGSLDNFFKGFLGVTTWEGIKANWKKYNRIYQAGANIISSIRSMTDSVRNVVELGAENTGRIGNALKKWGVVGENAYKWMPERVNAQTAWVQRLENLNNAADSIEMITSSILSVTQDANEIKKQLDEFNKGIANLQPKDPIENKPKSETEKFATRISTPPVVKEADGAPA